MEWIIGILLLFFSCCGVFASPDMERFEEAAAKCASRISEDETGAVEILKEILSTGTDPTAVQLARLKLAEIHLCADETGAAETMVSQVLLDGGENRVEMEAYRLLGLVNIRKGRLGKALMNFQDSLALADKAKCADIKAFDGYAIDRIADVFFRRLNARNVVRISPSGFGISAPRKIHVFRGDRIVVVNKKGVAGYFSPYSSRAEWHRIPVNAVVNAGAGPGGALLCVTKTGIFVDGKEVTLNVPAKQRKFISAVWTAPGEYWVLNKKTNAVLRFNPSGRLTGKIPMDGMSGEDKLVQDPLGGCWLFRGSLRKLVYFGHDGKRRKEIPLRTEAWSLDKFGDFTVDDIGFIYVLDRGANIIEILLKNGSHIGTIHLERFSEYFDAPSMIAVDSKGKPYVASRNSTSLFRIE